MNMSAFVSDLGFTGVCSTDSHHFCTWETWLNVQVGHAETLQCAAGVQLAHLIAGPMESQVPTA